MNRSFANGNGESASGTAIPLWLRHNLEYAEYRATQYSSWTVMA
ncbi:MAG TPA: hypothetical protein VGH54_29495 [Mycobacterium sp.]|jgi:hypothetical protein